MNQYRHMVLLTLILAALPNLAVLPIWVALIAIAGSAIHYYAPLHNASRGRGWYGKAAAAALLVAAAAGIWFSFESLFSGKAVLSFFIVVVFLKWGESRSRRDYLLLIFAAVILAAIGALYWENLWSLVHMLVVIFALTVSLVAIHGDPSFLTIRFLVRQATQMVLLGLPLMLLLFLTFPRIPGPLWDIGLAFGLPLKVMMDRSPGDFGKVTTLQPGGIHRASQEDDNVLVAEFDSVVPYKSRLYWRGPVYWDYDGDRWSLPENWDNRTRLLRTAIRSKDKLNRELRWRDKPVHYTLRVMPNGGRWLYGLDVPASPAPEAFISDDFQLLSIRRIDDREPKFEMLSYLDFHIGSELSDEKLARGLAWPEETNPRLLALGQELAQQYKESEDIVLHANRLLAAGNYQFDGAHVIPSGPDQLDRYFFDEKKGGAESLAGSFAMLMRAAGVPARLVSGYRGGSIIALTNFVIVKRSDAHAWVEVWHDDKGWVRVEPKDIVLPPAKKTDASDEDDAADNAFQVQITPAKGDLPQETERRSGGNKNSEADPVERSRWELPSFAALLGNLQKWVIQYNPDRQMEILQGVGLQQSNWLDLLITGVLGVLAMLGTYLTVAWWRGRTRVDPTTKAWSLFCARLNRLGIKKLPHECPRSYLQRASRERPELESALEDVIRRYIDIRYGGNDTPEATATFKQQVQRFVAMT